MLWQTVTTAETDEWRAGIERFPHPKRAPYQDSSHPRSVVAINLYDMQVRSKGDGIVNIYALRKDGDGLEIVYGPFPDGGGGLTRVVVDPPEWNI